MCFLHALLLSHSFSVLVLPTFPTLNCRRRQRCALCPAQENLSRGCKCSTFYCILQQQQIMEQLTARLGHQPKFFQNFDRTFSRSVRLRIFGRTGKELCSTLTQKCLEFTGHKSAPLITPKLHRTPTPQKKLLSGLHERRRIHFAHLGQVWELRKNVIKN